MNETLQKEIDLVEPNFIALKEEIGCYLAALKYYTDREPGTLGWKIDRVILINKLLILLNTRIGEWTTQIINGTKTAETFPQEVIDSIMDLNVYDSDEIENTPEDE